MGGDGVTMAAMTESSVRLAKVRKVNCVYWKVSFYIPFLFLFRYLTLF